MMPEPCHEEGLFPKQVAELLISLAFSGERIEGGILPFSAITTRCALICTSNIDLLHFPRLPMLH